MGERKDIKIVKRQQKRIKKHKATIFMLLGSANDYLESGEYTSTDVVMIVKTDEKFTGREWAKLMLAFQKELDKMTGDRLGETFV